MQQTPFATSSIDWARIWLHSVSDPAMRLIDIHTFEVLEFTANIPPYAILSHRWSDDEMSYKDYRKGPPSGLFWVSQSGELLSTLRGRAFTKRIVNTNQSVMKRHYMPLDIRDGSGTLNYAWIDMFAWYAQAAVCVAFLPGVENSHELSAASGDWFTRGWTLQELLAPDVVVFCNANLQVIGHKCPYKDTAYDRFSCMCRDHGTSANFMPSVNVAITSITGISEYYLQGESAAIQSSFVSAAVKMSWAAKRDTTRPEDLAYCLLGLFKINMPLLYGEGPAAFRRLQLHILDRDLDQSLLAFESKSGLAQYPLFADSPQSFGNSQYARDVGQLTIPFQIKQTILCIDVKVQRSLKTLGYDREILIIGLNCLTEKLAHNAEDNRRGEDNEVASTSPVILEGPRARRYELALAIHEDELDIRNFAMQHGDESPLEMTT